MLNNSTVFRPSWAGSNQIFFEIFGNLIGVELFNNYGQYCCNSFGIQDLSTEVLICHYCFCCTALSANCKEVV